MRRWLMLLPLFASRVSRRRAGARLPSRRLHALRLMLLGLVALLLSAPTVFAQSVYEWREPDGTVVYGQAPPGAAHKGPIRELRFAEQPPAQRAATARLRAAAQPAASVDARALRTADSQVAAALAALHKAERALREGQAPRPGERHHLVNGHSRLKRAYFDRIAGLEDAVAGARTALQTAYAGRDALAQR